MAEFYPSEVARLVLGYLHETNCKKTWDTFLEESEDLLEHCRLYRQGRRCTTDVRGESLLNILEAYCILRSFFETIVFQCSWTAVLEEIIHIREYYKLNKPKKSHSTANTYSSVINSLTELVSIVPNNNDCCQIENHASTSLQQPVSVKNCNIPHSSVPMEPTRVEKNVQTEPSISTVCQKFIDKVIQTDEVCSSAQNSTNEPTALLGNISADSNRCFNLLPSKELELHKPGPYVPVLHLDNQNLVLTPEKDQTRRIEAEKSPLRKDTSVWQKVLTESPTFKKMLENPSKLGSMTKTAKFNAELSEIVKYLSENQECLEQSILLDANSKSINIHPDCGQNESSDLNSTDKHVELNETGSVTKEICSSVDPSVNVNSVQSTKLITASEMGDTEMAGRDQNSSESTKEMNVIEKSGCVTNGGHSSDQYESSYSVNENVSCSNETPSNPQENNKNVDSVSADISDNILETVQNDLTQSSIQKESDNSLKAGFSTNVAKESQSFADSVNKTLPNDADVIEIPQENSGCNEIVTANNNLEMQSEKMDVEETAEKNDVSGVNQNATLNQDIAAATVNPKADKVSLKSFSQDQVVLSIPPQNTNVLYVPSLPSDGSFQNNVCTIYTINAPVGWNSSVYNGLQFVPSIASSSNVTNQSVFVTKPPIVPSKNTTLGPVVSHLPSQSSSCAPKADKVLLKNNAKEKDASKKKNTREVPKNSQRHCKRKNLQHTPKKDEGITYNTTDSNVPVLSLSESPNSVGQTSASEVVSKIEGMFEEQDKSPFLKLLSIEAEKLLKKTSSKDSLHVRCLNFDPKLSRPKTDDEVVIIDENTGLKKNTRLTEKPVQSVDKNDRPSPQTGKVTTTKKGKLSRNIQRSPTEKKITSPKKKRSAPKKKISSPKMKSSTLSNMKNKPQKKESEINCEKNSKTDDINSGLALRQSKRIQNRKKKGNSNMNKLNTECSTCFTHNQPTPVNDEIVPLSENIEQDVPQNYNEINKAEKTTESLFAGKNDKPLLSVYVCKSSKDRFEKITNDANTEALNKKKGMLLQCEKNEALEMKHKKGHAEKTFKTYSKGLGNGKIIHNEENQPQKCDESSKPNESSKTSVQRKENDAQTECDKVQNCNENMSVNCKTAEQNDVPLKESAVVVRDNVKTKLINPSHVLVCDKRNKHKKGHDEKTVKSYSKGLGIGKIIHNEENQPQKCVENNKPNESSKTSVQSKENEAQTECDKVQNCNENMSFNCNEMLIEKPEQIGESEKNNTSIFAPGCADLFSTQHSAHENNAECSNGLPSVINKRKMMHPKKRIKSNYLDISNIDSEVVPGSAEKMAKDSVCNTSNDVTISTRSNVLSFSKNTADTTQHASAMNLNLKSSVTSSGIEKSTNEDIDVITLEDSEEDCNNSAFFDDLDTETQPAISNENVVNSSEINFKGLKNLVISVHANNTKNLKKNCETVLLKKAAFGEKTIHLSESAVTGETNFLRSENISNNCDEDAVAFRTIATVQELSSSNLCDKSNESMDKETPNTKIVDKSSVLVDAPKDVNQKSYTSVRTLRNEQQAQVIVIRQPKGPNGTKGFWPPRHPFKNVSCIEFKDALSSIPNLIEPKERSSQSLNNLVPTKHIFCANPPSYRNNKRKVESFNLNNSFKVSFPPAPEQVIMSHPENSNCDTSKAENLHPSENLTLNITNSADTKRKFNECISDDEEILFHKKNRKNFGSPDITKKRVCRKLSSSSDEMQMSEPETDTHCNDQDISDSGLKNNNSLQAVLSELSNDSTVKVPCIKQVSAHKSKHLKYSPVRYPKDSKKIVLNKKKTVLGKQIEKDPNIPAGVKIPHNWNNSNLITYSDEVRQSVINNKSERKFIAGGKKEKLTGKSKKKSGTSKSTKKLGNQKHGFKLALVPENKNTDEQISSDDVPIVKQKSKISSACDMEVDNSSVAHIPSVETSAEINIEEIADHGIDLINAPEQSAEKSPAERNANLLVHTSHNLDPVPASTDDRKRTQDATQASIEKSNAEQSQLDLAVASCEMELQKSEPFQTSSSPIGYSSITPVKTESEASTSSSSSVIDSRKIKFLQSLVQKYGYDYIMSKLENLESST